MRGNLSIDSTLTVAAGAAAGSPAEAAKERAALVAADSTSSLRALKSSTANGP